MRTNRKVSSGDSGTRGSGSGAARGGPKQESAALGASETMLCVTAAGAATRRRGQARV